MRSDRRLCGAVVFGVLLLGSVCAGRGDEPIDDKARAEHSLGLAKQWAGSYAFRSDRSDELYEFHPQPVLRWSNPVVGSVYGNVFVWTEHGRPEVVGSFQRWYSPDTHGGHELHSLSLGTFTAQRDGTPVWNSRTAGVELKPVPDAPEPAASPTIRLRQMHDLSRGFTARQTDRKDIDRDLRLLVQPIYRYEATEGDLIDGALFVFVLATDPEIFLQLEARRTGGIPQWQFALARFNSVSLRVSYREREVWNAPTMPWNEVYDHARPYTTFRIPPVVAVPKPAQR